MVKIVWRIVDGRGREKENVGRCFDVRSLQTKSRRLTWTNEDEVRRSIALCKGSIAPTRHYNIAVCSIRLSLCWHEIILPDDGVYCVDA